jgi:uncharacterized protein YqjF (DUF2071 family)
VQHDFDTRILDVVAHRPWAMPAGPWVMTQTWHDLLFAHWPLAPEQLAGKVPPQLPLDLFDGQAWIGIVPFHMTNVAPRGVPSLPWVSEFPELNVRTYVRVDERPGVYFFSLDAGSTIAVRTARALFNLPYYSASMRVAPTAEGIDYASRRSGDGAAVLSASYGPTGPSFLAPKGSLEYFLTERYCLYNLDRRGAPYRLDIHHRPWPLQPTHARIDENTMAAVHGITLPARPPLVHFAKRLDVVAWSPERIGSD